MFTVFKMKRSKNCLLQVDLVKGCKPPKLGTRYLKSSGAAAAAVRQKKSSGTAAYRYSNKKVAPLPLLASKTAAAAATLKKQRIKNDGIQIRYLMMKFQLSLRKYIIKAFKILVQVKIGTNRLK